MTRNLVLLAGALIATAGITAGGVLGAGVTRHGDPAGRASVVSAPTRSEPAGGAAATLRAWDAARAEAWSRGDPRLLRRLYTPGSVAGRRDRAMLRAWVGRGLVVRGLQTQLLEVRELSRGGREWRLRVTDRVAGGTVVGADSGLVLPHDGATTRTVVLRRAGRHWLVAAVTPVRTGRS